jgi:ATP-dependent Lhr-like helicase
VELPPIIADWLAAKGWRLRSHQAAMLKRADEHRLLVAGTGAGKTLSGFLPTLAELAERPREGLHTLYVSPLKALAVDVRRNLIAPVEEMELPVSVETRTGDTPADRKARQRQRPPNILLTTPESLSLLLSFPDAGRLFADLRSVVIDELHAFAPSKRGDLLALALTRLSALAPGHVRVGLSATVADETAYRRWLAPHADPAQVALIRGERGAEAEIGILLPEGRVPWSGHSGRYAAKQVYEQIRDNRSTLVFCNTRGLAELIFQDLWAVNEDRLPIGIHHGSLAVEARRKVEGAMADGRLRALVATASLDLGVDWGEIDLVIQMGAPKGSSRLIQRIGRANHRLDVPSRGLIVPGNRFEYLEARAALDAVAEGALDAEVFRPGALDVLAQHIMGTACAAPFSADQLFAEVTRAAPYADLARELFDETLRFVENGAYALKAYDKFRRIRQDADGRWRVTAPRFAQQHRENAGIIVDAPVLSVKFRNGRKLGTVEDYFASTLRPGDTFYFSGLSLEVERFEAADLIVRASTRPARIPTYVGTRLALSTSLADRVRHFLHDRQEWRRFPADVQEWLQVQEQRSRLPAPGELLVETFERDGRHHMIAYSFEGWNAHQALGMLVTRRMAAAGLQPTGFVSNDYALACYGLEPIRDPAPLFSADILEDEFKAWIEESPLLKRAFREVAIIGGLVERQTTGQRKPGRALTISTDLIYDVLRKHEPQHLLLRAAWEDARARLTDVGRLARLLETAQDRLVHVDLPRVSPLAVPVLVLIGREVVRDASADDAILAEAEQLAAEAMRLD